MGTMRRYFVFLSLSLVVMLPLSASPAAQEDIYSDSRREMVQNDLAGRGIEDERVLKAMMKIPRHLFVPRLERWMSYGDHALPIGEGQTISQPYVVAIMTEALELKPGDRVLEIGTGSGYQAAVLAEMVREVYTIEIRRTLAMDAEKLLKELEYTNISVKHADGYFGWEKHAPFDAIMITAAANHIPPPLIRQLREGGRIILPLGSTTYYQMLTIGTKKDGKLKLRQIAPVAFVPMTGEMVK
jgi:protein-L-isoaspartate(D-aspartate) O-methyltransferase